MACITWCPVVEPGYPSTDSHLLKILLAVLVANLLDRIKAAKGQGLVLVDGRSHILAVVAGFYFLWIIFKE